MTYVFQMWNVFGCSEKENSHSAQHSYNYRYSYHNQCSVLKAYRCEFLARVARNTGDGEEARFLHLHTKETEILEF